MSHQDKQPTTPQKVVILGGGMGALATAFTLTQNKNWRETYSSITIYQMGWRLGGKGVSGRGKNDRVEEHGLHVWMGFYHNAFRMIQDCYKELDRPVDAPLATWEQAFSKSSDVILARHRDDRYNLWHFKFPSNHDVPGQKEPFPSPRAYLEMILELIMELMTQLENHVSYASRGCRPDVGKICSSFHSRKNSALSKLLVLLKKLSNQSSRVVSSGLTILLRGLTRSHLHLLRTSQEQRHIDDKLDEILTLLDFGMALTRGMLLDGVWKDGFESINQYDLLEWLQRHGLEEPNHPLTRTLYSMFFAYAEGDVEKPRLAAGVAIQFLLRMGLTYKGAILWNMQAGMGDAIFAPMYEVLAKRGVAIQFFHRVDSLHPDAAGSSIEQVKMTSQVHLKNEDYRPLKDVKGLPSWPNEPLWEQIKGANDIKSKLKPFHLSLESSWAPSLGEEHETTVTLRHGEDYDMLVLGISLGALPRICSELGERRAAWSQMFESVKTVPIQSVQLWMSKDQAQLGWKGPPALVSSYAEPFNSYLDTSHFLPLESWPEDSQPKSIGSFAGPLLEKQAPPALSEHGYPHSQDLRAKQSMLKWINQNIDGLWPSSVASNPENHQKEFKWEWLVPSEEKESIDAQFWRAQVEPSNRYVQSIPNSISKRLAPDRSGFANLYLAGDWTQTELNCGCVEAAVNSGSTAAFAIIRKASKKVPKKASKKGS